MTPTPKEGQIKKPAIGMDGDSQPARSGGGEAILSQEGPPTLRECREMLHILNSFYSMNVFDQKHLENVDRAKNILDRLTDEALELDEKRRAALEENNKALRAALIMHRRDLHGMSTRPCPTCRQSAEALGIKNHGQCARWQWDKPELDALTPKEE